MVPLTNSAVFRQCHIAGGDVCILSDPRDSDSTMIVMHSTAQDAILQRFQEPIYAS